MKIRRGKAMTTLMSVEYLSATIKSRSSADTIFLKKGVNEFSYDRLLYEDWKRTTQHVKAGIGCFYPDELRAGRNWHGLLEEYLSTGSLQGRIVTGKSLFGKRLMNQVFYLYSECIISHASVPDNDDIRSYNPLEGKYYFSNWACRDQIIHSENIYEVGEQLLDAKNDLLANKIWQGIIHGNGELRDILENEIGRKLQDLTKDEGIFIVNQAWLLAAALHRVPLNKIDAFENITQNSRKCAAQDKQDWRISAILALTINTLKKLRATLNLYQSKYWSDLSECEELIKETWEKNPLLLFLIVIYIIDECTARLCWSSKSIKILEDNWDIKNVDKTVPVIKLDFDIINPNFAKLKYTFGPKEEIQDFEEINRIPPISTRHHKWLKIAIKDQFLGLWTPKQESMLGFMWNSNEEDVIIPDDFNWKIDLLLESEWIDEPNKVTLRYGKTLMQNTSEEVISLQSQESHLRIVIKRKTEADIVTKKIENITRLQGEFKVQIDEMIKQNFDSKALSEGCEKIKNLIIELENPKIK
jgi:hypothetical protein